MTVQTLVKQYVDLKRSSGAAFQSGAAILEMFVRAFGPDAQVTEIQSDQVSEFLRGDGRVTYYFHRKYYALAGLYTYAITRGYAAANPLPRTIPKNPPALVPYIYSRAEIRRLLDSASQYRKQGLHLELETFRTILLLLYAAGLRISEAVSLDVGDADLPNAILTVRETKFYKTRFVPLGSELCREMATYAERTVEIHGRRAEQQPFFVDRHGVRLRIPTVRQAFDELRRTAGVKRDDGGRYQPRLHDLRHSFAVHRLTDWYQAGADVQKLLPCLSTYLGHHSIVATQKYLTMTPELLRQASLRFAAFAEVRHG
jgi:site-specific recombinase XerD